MISFNIIALLCCHATYGQKSIQSIEFRCRLLFKNFPVEGAHIINSSLNTTATSDLNGDFIILAKPQDSLEIRTLNFKLKKLVISTEQLKHEKTLIELEELRTPLREVTISSSGLTGDLEKDLSTIPFKTYDPSHILGIAVFDGEPQERIPSVFETFGYGLPTNIQIEPLYKHISGYYKNLRKKRAHTNDTETAEEIRRFFGENFFETSFSIPSNSVLRFIFYCMEKDGSLSDKFKAENYAAVLETFNTNVHAFEN